MLSDRDYMREPNFGRGYSWTVRLLIVLVVCFVIQAILQFYAPRFPLFQWFALTPNSLFGGAVWQLLTFQFLHAPFGGGGFFHIFFNAWCIYIFGSPVEERLGPKRFLILYLGCGVAGGLAQSLATLVFPISPAAPVVGASAGAFGLLAAYCALYPDRQLQLLLFFVLPVTLTSRMLLIFSGLIALFGTIVPSGGVAHAAHLGGLLAGLGFVRWLLDYEFGMPRWFSRPRSQGVVRQPARPLERWPAAEKPAAPPEPSPGEFISREVDPILDKISAHGIHSLTAEERKILDAARSKMGRL